MRLQKERYSFKKFLDSCNELKKTTKKSLKIYTLLFKPHKSEKIFDIFRNCGYDVNNSEFGEVTEISTTIKIYDREKRIYFYVLKHPKYEEVYYFFSFNGSGDIYNTLPKVIDSVSTLFYLWLPPNYFDSLKENILKKEGSYITYFHGKKLDDTGRQECKRRPMFSRDIKYEGNDAKISSEEFRFEYGVMPQNIEFVIPAVSQFRINKNGCYTLFFGDVGEFLHNIIENAIEMVIKDNQEIEKAKFDITKKDELEVLNSKEINFILQQEISYEEFEEFIKIMEKSDFGVYNVRLTEGSVIFSGNVVDELKGNIFSVTSDGKRFTIIPKYDTNTMSIIRFQKFLIEKIDQLARITYQ